MRSMAILLAAFATAAPGGMGCSAPKAEPQLASSANHPTYAVRFASEMHDAKNEFMTAEREVTRLVGNFDGYAATLDAPSWSHVLLMVQRADEAGRSYGYVDAYERTRYVAAFFEDEKKVISRKVGGAAQHAAKRKGCEADVQSPAVHALGKAVDERIEKRLRASNPAHRLVDEYEAAFKKRNLARLREQIDAITLASYYSSVGIVRAKQKLARMSEEVEAVKRTLHSEIEDAKRAFAEAETKAEKAAARERQSRAIATKNAIGSQVSSARTLLEQADDRIQKVQGEYRRALDALKEQIREKAGAGQTY